MNKHNRIILIFTTVILGACLLLGGCASAKKPVNPPPVNPPDTGIDTPAPGKTQQIANRIADEANNVKGVNEASAVVSANTIYLGLDVDSSLDRSQAKSVEMAVLDRIKRMEPSYTITVTSDADTVNRIKGVSQGIDRGESLSSFTKEIEDIGSRMKPSSK